MVRQSFFSRRKDKFSGLQSGRLPTGTPGGRVDNILKMKSNNEKAGPSAASSSKTVGDKSGKLPSCINLNSNSFTFDLGPSEKSNAEEVNRTETTLSNRLEILVDADRIQSSDVFPSTSASSYSRLKTSGFHHTESAADICHSYEDDELFSFNQDVADFRPQTNNQGVQRDPTRLFRVSDSRKSVPEVITTNPSEGERSSLSNLLRLSNNQTTTTPKRPTPQFFAERCGFLRTPKKRTLVASTTPSVDEDCDDLDISEISDVVEENEASKLESSIVVEESPVKVKVLKSRRLKSLQLKQKNLKTTPISGVDSQDSNNIRLSGRISEYSSTQSQSSSSPIPKTPLAVWVRKDQSVKGGDDIDEIIEFDSPSKRKLQQNARTNSEKRRATGLSLLDSFKSIKAHYDSSVRRFGHDFRKKKYDEETAMHLLIRNIERQDKTLHVTAYNFKEERHVYILFKPLDLYEIREGVLLKLYQPWQEVHVSDTSCTMIIASNFYKIANRNEFSFTDEQLAKIKESPLPQAGVIGVTEPLLMDLVPYHLKNQRTVLKEIERYSSFINIEVLILYVWQETLPVMALIKDSDDFISLLEVPKTEEDLISTLSPGRFVSLAQIGVERMINIAQQLDVFSLLRLFGAKQTYYCILKWDYDSKWELEALLDIPAVHGWEQLLNIEEIYMVPRHEDQRVSLECRLKQIEADHILVTDDSDMSLKIEFVFNSEKLFPNMLNNINRVLSFKFLRVIYGKTIWDKFTTFINTDNVVQEIEVDEGF